MFGLRIYFKDFSSLIIKTTVKDSIIKTEVWEKKSYFSILIGGIYDVKVVIEGCFKKSKKLRITRATRFIITREKRK